MDQQEEAMNIISKEMGLPEKASSARSQIEEAIRSLILNDMNRLISLLYRMDVDERKLSSVLENDSTGDSAKLITDLVIERQIRRIRSREQMKFGDDKIPDDEKW